MRLATILAWITCCLVGGVSAAPFAKPVYPIPVPEPVMNKCIGIAAQTYNIEPTVLRALQAQEGGKIGTISRNDNGSFDLGPMQINTINLPEIKRAFPFLSWRHIVYEPCINIMIGAWFLRKKIDNRNGNVWEGVGDYHSRTPAKRIIYLRSFLAHYSKMDERYGNTPPKMLTASN